MVDFPQELSELLKETVGFTDKELDDYFKLNENENEWILTAKEWLEISTYKTMRELCEQKGGAYNPNPPTFFIPKEGREVEAPATSEVAPNEQLESSVGPQPVTVKNNSKNPYDLKASVEILPMLKEARPVIQDEKGVKIDGFHRLTVDKDWPTKTVQITDELTRMMARFSLNFCRRKLSDKEKRDAMVAFHLKTGWSPKEMAEHLPISYSFIMKYLPDEYKDKEMAEVGKKGAEVKVEVDKRLATRRVAEPLVLHRCGFSTVESYDHGAYKPKFVDGIPLCSHHYELVKNDPSLLKKLKEKPSPPKKVEKKTYEAGVPKPTWAERQELMHPTKSKMEREVIQELQEEGWPIDTEYWIPLTKPDGYLHEIRLPLEVDGEQVHKGKKAERDELVNEILMHRGIEPARERFSHYSMKRKEEIKASFRERIIQGYREKGLELPLKVQEIVESASRG